jgi:hypothetical protein
MAYKVTVAYDRHLSLSRLIMLCFFAAWMLLRLEMFWVVRLCGSSHFERLQCLPVVQRNVLEDFEPSSFLYFIAFKLLECSEFLTRGCRKVAACFQRRMAKD